MFLWNKHSITQKIDQKKSKPLKSMVMLVLMFVVVDFVMLVMVDFVMLVVVDLEVHVMMLLKNSEYSKKITRMQKH